MERFLEGGLFLLVVNLTIVGLAYSSQDPFQAANNGQQRTEVEAASEQPLLHLYFADRDKGVLSSEPKAFAQVMPPAHLAAMVINLLVKGPGGSLQPTLPQGTRLNALYLLEDGTALLDFNEALRDGHPGGIQAELLTIYSIVNSLLLNIPVIDSVKILIEGHETLSLAGHVDLRFAFKANMLIVR